MVKSRSTRLVGSKQMNPRVSTGNYEVAHISYELNVLGARITMKKLTSSRKGGNYGWSMYEGPFRFKNASGDDSADPIFPVLGYNHSGVNKKVGSAAISGGYV